MAAVFRRLLAAAFGVSIIVGDVWLGILSMNGGWFVVWFGVASAIAIPLALAAIAWAIRYESNRRMERLLTVPEIDRLVEQAKTEEQKIQVLRQEYQRLEETIQSESAKVALAVKRQDLVDRAEKLVKEFRIVDAELSKLQGYAPDIVHKELEELRRYIDAKIRGDPVVRFGKKTYILPIVDAGGLLFPSPFAGISVIFNLIEALRRKHSRKRLDDVPILVESARPGAPKKPGKKSAKR